MAKFSWGKARVDHDIREGLIQSKDYEWVSKYRHDENPNEDAKKWRRQIGAKKCVGSGAIAPQRKHAD